MIFYSSGYRIYNYFRQETGPIWLDDLGCSGSELTLLQCSHNGLGSHDCGHYEDVSVRCIGDKTGSLFKLKLFSDLFRCPYTGSCTNGDVRLVGGSNITSGLVEVCANNRWGTVCDYHWDNNDAKVVCRMLNYSSSGTYLYSIYYVIVLYFRCYC